jgi:hypothetical protein
MKRSGIDFNKNDFNNTLTIIDRDSISFKKTSETSTPKNVRISKKSNYSNDNIINFYMNKNENKTINKKLSKSQTPLSKAFPKKDSTNSENSLRVVLNNNHENYPNDNLTKLDNEQNMLDRVNPSFMSD